MTDRWWWAAVPNALLLDPSLSAGAARLWCQLVAVCQDQPTCEVDNGSLAALAGCSGREVRRRAAELVAAGWLAVDVGGGRSSSTFEPLQRVPLARTSRSGLAGVTPDRAVRARALTGPPAQRGTAREEETGVVGVGVDAADGAAAPRPWCGRCEDPLSRGSYDERGAFTRCPDCHPALTARIF